MILRGCIPGDKEYSEEEIIRHIDGIFVTNPRQNLISFLLQGFKCDEDGIPWTTDSIISKFVPNQFIYSRSILLGALADGLTLEGKPSSTPNDLREGCGFARILNTVPLEAVQRILFSRPSITLDDVLGILSPIYCAGDADWDGKAEDLIFLRSKQEEFYNNDFKRYLSEGSTEATSFLTNFIQCCTGSNYLPFMTHDGTPFKVIVEFNIISPEAGCHPLFQTCSNTILLPGMGLYFDDYELFQQKTNEAIDSSFNQFNMQ